LQYALQEAAGDEVVLQSISPENESKGWETGAARITKVTLTNLEQPEQSFFEGGEHVSLKIDVQAAHRLQKPIIGFLLRDRLGQDLFGDNTLSTAQSNTAITLSAGDRATGTFRFRLPLLPNGQYAIACSIADGDLHENTQHHFIHDALILTVSSTKNRWGLVGIACDEISLERQHD
jgi:lipopolysaccharide transport system ATP-binding protein